MRSTAEHTRTRRSAGGDARVGLGRHPELHRRSGGRARYLDHHGRGHDDQVARRHGAAGRGKVRSVMTPRPGETLTRDTATGVFQRLWREVTTAPGSLRSVSIAVTASYTERS